MPRQRRLPRLRKKMERAGKEEAISMRRAAFKGRMNEEDVGAYGGGEAGRERKAG